MGIDIRLFVEKRTERGWVPVLKGWNPRWCEPLRNYDLFALLAGVKNYAGVKPIAEPRGLPPDVTPFVKKKYHSYDYDQFDASYLTVKELVEANWEQEFTQYRYMDTPPFKMTLREACRSFLENHLKQLQKLAENDPESVRIVFWFIF